MMMKGNRLEAKMKTRRQWQHQHFFFSILVAVLVGPGQEKFVIVV
jgi:hypothetical protein